jgi:hypothetical protein
MGRYRREIEVVLFGNLGHDLLHFFRAFHFINTSFSGVSQIKPENLIQP